jgi:hypothetical protein
MFRPTMLCISLVIIKYLKNYVTFQVLIVASMKMRAFWDIAPYSFGVDQCFRGAYCFHHLGNYHMVLYPILAAVRT